MRKSYLALAVFLISAFAAVSIGTFMIVNKDTSSSGAIEQRNSVALNADEENTNLPDSGEGTVNMDANQKIDIDNIKGKAEVK